MSQKQCLFLNQELEIKLERRKRLSVAEPESCDPSEPEHQQLTYRSGETQRKEMLPWELNNNANYRGNISTGTL